MHERPTRLLGAGVRAAIALVLTGFAAWSVGIDTGHLVALALAVGAVTLAVQVVAPAPVVGWTIEPELELGVGWHQVLLADRALEQLDAEPERVPRTLLPRLRELAAGRLHRLGVPATSPRARDLLGDELYDLLGDAPGHAARPGATDLTRRLLDRLDEIDPPEETDDRAAR